MEKLTECEPCLRRRMPLKLHPAPGTLSGQAPGRLCFLPTFYHSVQVNRVLSCPGRVEFLAPF